MTSDFKVKAGVKLPTVEETKNRTPRKYPFDTVKVGEIFFVPDKTADKFSTYAARQAKLLGRKFRSQTIVMRQDLQTNEWELCKSGAPGAKRGTAVTRIA